MKKKILLLAMMVAVLSCLFVLSVSAQTVTYEGQEIELVNNLGDPSWYTGNTALAIKDKESIVILKDADGNMTAYPSYYILRFGVEMKDGAPSNVYVLWADQNGVDYSFVNEKADKEYASGSIYYIEFPYGMTKCMSNSIFGRDNDSKPESNVVEIVIPDSVTVIDSQAFRRMNSCRKVTMSKNVTSLSNWSFCGSTKLETVVLPEDTLLETLGNSFDGCTALTTFNLSNAKNIVSIGDDAFRNTSLSESIDFSNCTGLKTIGSAAFRNTKVTGLNLSGCTSLESIGSYAFENVSTLTFVDLSNTTSLQTIYSGAFVSNTSLSSVTLEGSSCKTISNEVFNNCTSLRNITLCDSIETIGNKAFYKNGSLKLASDYLPKNLKTIGTHFLSGCNIQNDVLYFPEGFTSLSSEYNFNDGAKYEGTGFTLVFLGKMTAVRIDDMDANSSFKGLQIVFAQNTSSEVNGKFVIGTTFKDNHAYIAKDSTGALALNKEVTTGTLNLTLRNNDPNSNGEAGTDANGNKIYSINSITPRFIFCGGNDVDFIYQVRNDISGWNYYLTTPFAYDMDAHTTAGTHYNSIVHSAVNCGYDETTTKTCVICKEQSVVIGATATGEHTYEDDFNCETALTCDVCEKTLAEALAHILNTEIVYANGSYDKNGEKLVICQNEGCTVCNTSEPTAPLFVINGFSASGNGIMYNYIVNREAIAEYKTYGGVIYFGVVVSIGNGGNILNADGSLVDGTKGYASNLTERGNDLYEIAVKGIPSDHLATQIVCCGYISDGTSLQYMGATALEEAAAPVTLQSLVDAMAVDVKEEY